MAKRFADTKLTREAWYRRLKPVFKAAWRFLTDECDCAGIWAIDTDAMAFHVGEEVDLEALLSAVNADRPNRLVRISGDKLFIPGFIQFQYGELKHECKPHRPVLKRLAEVDLPKEYRKGFETLKDKDKDKEKEKEKEGGVGETPRLRPVFDFDAALASSGFAINGPFALERFNEQIQSTADFESLLAAIKHYRAHLSANPWKSPKQSFASFLGTPDEGFFWRDFISPDSANHAVFGTSQSGIDAFLAERSSGAGGVQ